MTNLPSLEQRLFRCNNGVYFFFSGLYILIIMIVTTVSLAMTILVLHFHHHPADKPVPHWLRRFFLEYVESWLCLKKLRRRRKKKNQAGVEEGDSCLKSTGHCNGNEAGDDAKSEEYAADWQRVARVLDRLLFWVFTVIVGITTLFFFIATRV